MPSHPIWISLNLARASLEDLKLFQHIDAAVEANALKPWTLHIEITEALAMEYLDQVRLLTFKLKAIGCCVVLDDFGRGPAHQYLEQLPVDIVKIDGELIHGLMTNQSDKALVRRITEQAHKRGIQVVAKSVQDPALLATLRELDVDYAQGFAIGMPVEAIEQVQANEAAVQGG